VEEETKRDLADIAGLVHVLWIALTITGLVGLIAAGMTSLGLVLIGAGVLIAIVAGLVFTRAPSMDELESEYEPPQSHDGQVVLDYAHNRQRKQVTHHESFRVPAFISGFFSSIVLVTLVVLALMNSKSGQEAIFIYCATSVAILGLAYAAVRLGRDPRFNGIGRGVVTGFVFAFLAPFGFCFLMVAAK